MTTVDLENAIPVEEILQQALSGEVLTSALDFISFLRQHDLPPLAVGKNSWQVPYQGEILCNLWLAEELDPVSVFVWPYYDGKEPPEGFTFEEPLQRTAIAHVNYCTTGHCDQSPGLTQVIFGQSFEKVCTAPIAFINPDQEAIACAKRLVEMRKFVLDQTV